MFHIVFKSRLQNEKKEFQLLDPFFKGRREIFFSGTEKKSLSRATVSVARELARQSFQQPDRKMLDALDVVETHEQFYLLQVLFMMGARDDLQLFDRRFLEIVTLHRLQNKLHCGEFITESQRRSIAVLGAMIQRRLTLLLLELDPRQYQRLWEFKYTKGIETGTWERSLVGASAVARVVLSIKTLPTVRKFLSSTIEDVSQAMDLIVIREDGVGACLSVKLQNGEQQSTHAYVCTQSSLACSGSRAHQHVHSGTQIFNRENGRSYTPTLVIVTKIRGQAVMLNRRSLCDNWIHELFRKIDAENRA